MRLSQLKLSRAEESPALPLVQVVSDEEQNGSTATFADLLDKAEEMMVNLTTQISNYVNYDSKPSKIICNDRATSPVAVKKRSAKVLCKPCGKSVGVMPLNTENKVDVSIQVNDDLIQMSVVNQGTSTNVLDLEKAESLLNIEHEKPLESNTKTLSVENESTDEPLSVIKTKLTIQQMPSIDIPRSLVMQRIPDIVITATESLPATEILHDTNIGYVIAKHSNTVRTDVVIKHSKESKRPCGCTKKHNNCLKVQENLPVKFVEHNSDPTNPTTTTDNHSILRTKAVSDYDKAKESSESSVVSFDYRNKMFETTKGTPNEENVQNVDYFNGSYKSEDNVSQVISVASDTEEDVFERSSRLSTYKELGNSHPHKVKEYVKDVTKNPRTEIMFKSFQLISDNMEIDMDVGTGEIDISSVDVNFYKTFVNPNGPKNVDGESSNVSNPSSTKLKQPVLPKAITKPPDEISSNQTFLPLSENQQFPTVNDNTKPSDSDFSEVLVGLTKNVAKNSYQNDVVEDKGDDAIALQRIEEDPILKVRELYQEAVRTSRKSGQFVNTHSISIDVTIPPDIQEKIHGQRTSSIRKSEIESKVIEPFTKAQPEKAVPRMIDVNVNNFLNNVATASSATSIYSDTTEDVILGIDSEALRETQQQNTNARLSTKAEESDWNNIGSDESQYVITHDVSIQTSLEEINEEFNMTNLNDNENPNANNWNQPADLPIYSYTSENKNSGEDTASEVVQRKSVKIEEPNYAVQNKTANEITQEKSMISFISELTKSDANLLKEPTWTKTSNPSQLSKYFIPDNSPAIEMSTQTSNSEIDLLETIKNEGETQTDVWRAEINPTRFPDFSNSKEVHRMNEIGNIDHIRGDEPNGSIHSKSQKQEPRESYDSSASSTSPIYTIHTNLNQAWESSSNSEALHVPSEKSEGEISVKFSASIGEIHNCATKSTPRHLRKHPQDIIVREFQKDNMKIRRKKVYNRNWISYYVSRSSSPSILDETSDSVGLVKRT